MISAVLIEKILCSQLQVNGWLNYSMALKR
jgi:hypothetical protein